eukprot:gi/632950386/ref/XP_007890688.1/ PREDICTED: uncharacterized protein LOC103178020 [Callorhinchus milii]
MKCFFVGAQECREKEMKLFLLVDFLNVFILLLFHLNSTSGRSNGVKIKSNPADRKESLDYRMERARQEMMPSSTWVFYALSSCHRTVQGTSGWFFSPSYPDTYPENIWCNWTIRADRWQHFEVQIHGFTSQEACDQNADEIFIERVPGQAESLLVQACLNNTRHVYDTHALAVYVIFLSKNNPHRSERRFRVEYDVAPEMKTGSESEGLHTVDLKSKKVRADAKINESLHKAQFESFQSNGAKAENASLIRAIFPRNFLDTKATTSSGTSSDLNLEPVPAEWLGSLKVPLTLQPFQTKSYGFKEVDYSVALSSATKLLTSGSSVTEQKQVEADLNRVTRGSDVKMSDQVSNPIRGDMLNMFTLLEELYSSSELHQYVLPEYHQTPVVYPDVFQPGPPRTTVIPQKLSMTSELVGSQIQDIFRAQDIAERPRNVMSVSYSIGTLHEAVYHHPVHHSPRSGSGSLPLSVYQGEVNPMLESILFGSLVKLHLDETTRESLECTGCSLGVANSLLRATSKGAGSLFPCGTEIHDCIWPSFKSDEIEVVSDAVFQQKFDHTTIHPLETSSLFSDQWSNGRLEPESSMRSISYPVEGIAEVPTSSYGRTTYSNAVSRTESWDRGTEQWAAQSNWLTVVNSPSLDPAIKTGEAEGETVLNVQSSIKPSSVLPSVEWIASRHSYQGGGFVREMPDPPKTNPGDYLFEVHIGVEFVGIDLKNSEEIEKRLKRSIPNLVTENLSSFSPTLKGLFLRDIDRTESPDMNFTYWLYFNSSDKPMYIPLKIQMDKLLNKPVTNLRSGEALVGLISIEDVDECLAGIAMCHTNTTCLNAFGSYFCHCTKGFEDDLTVSSIKCTETMKSDLVVGVTPPFESDQMEDGGQSVHSESFDQTWIEPSKSLGPGDVWRKMQTDHLPLSEPKSSALAATRRVDGEAPLRDSESLNGIQKLWPASSETYQQTRRKARPCTTLELEGSLKTTTYGIEGQFEWTHSEKLDRRSTSQLHSSRYSNLGQEHERPKLYESEYFIQTPTYQMNVRSFQPVAPKHRHGPVAGSPGVPTAEVWSSEVEWQKGTQESRWSPTSPPAPLLSAALDTINTEQFLGFQLSILPSSVSLTRIWTTLDEVDIDSGATPTISDPHKPRIGGNLFEVSAGVELDGVVYKNLHELEKKVLNAVQTLIMESLSSFSPPIREMYLSNVKR